MSLGTLIRQTLAERGPLSRPAIEALAERAGYEATSVAVELHRLKQAGKINHIASWRGHSLYGSKDVRP